MKTGAKVKLFQRNHIIFSKLGNIGNQSNKSNYIL